MSRLQNKVALSTGGTSGIGLATAQRFVAEGAFVSIFARRQEELDKTVASIGWNIAGVQGDVRKLEDLDRLYAKVASDGRRLDVVIANVGAVDSVKLADVAIESFNHNVDVNARGVQPSGALPNREAHARSHLEGGFQCRSSKEKSLSSRAAVAV